VIPTINSIVELNEWLSAHIDTVFTKPNTPTRSPMHVVKVDRELVSTAKARGVAEREMAVSAEELFATLEDGASYRRWVPAIRQVTWTGAKPFGMGTTRTVNLAGGARVDEVFWAWETNRRIGFSITASSMRWLTALTELYEITAVSSDRCTVRWALAVRLSGVYGRVEPHIGRLMPSAQNRMLKALERVARERSSVA
jgi:ribosome-associated toxin RatA of RatAB toxin-antitoxin module